MGLINCNMYNWMLIFYLHAQVCNKAYLSIKNGDMNDMDRILLEQHGYNPSETLTNSSKKCCNFWKAEVENQTNPRQVWSTIDKILCRQKSTTTDGRLICNILRQKDRRHPINNWERTFSYIHRQSIRWKVHNIQTPGHKWRHEPNSEGSTETMCTWSDSNVVVEGLHWSVGTIHHLCLQYLTLLWVRTQQFQRRLHHSFTEEELDETTVGNYRPVSNLSVL